MSQTETQRRAIPTPRKWAYSLGDLTISTVIGALSIVFFFFLTTVAGLEPWRAGALVWIARIVDAVTDPMMGRISDRTQTRFGRRRPWFLVGAIPFGVAYALLWQVPFSGQTAMSLYYLSVYVALSLAMTVLSVPYMALIPEWSRDFDERTSVNTVRAAASIVGTIVAATLPEFAEARGDDAAAFGWLGIVVGACLALPWLAVFFASQEPKRGAMPAHPVRLRESLRTLATHRNYLRLCGLYLCARVAVDLLGLAYPLYMAVWLGRKGEISSVLLTMLVVVVLSLPIWLRISKRAEKHQVFIAGALWFAAMLVLIGLATPEWPAYTTLIIAALIGFGYAICDLMPWAMLGEVIDEDELLTGERREGLYNGVFTFLRKAGGASAYGLAGIALSAAGYEPEAASSTEVTWVIRAVTSVVPGLFLLAAVALAIGYPLTRARDHQIQAALAARERAIRAGHPPH